VGKKKKEISVIEAIFFFSSNERKGLEHLERIQKIDG